MQGFFEQSSAVMSKDQQYRYHLTRLTTVCSEDSCLFIMLNPSTADANKDDPTIRRCVRYAEGWGYGKMEVVNLFAFRATSPKMLKVCHSPIGEANDEYILLRMEYARDNGGLVVAAWGTNGGYMSRDTAIKGLASQIGVTLHTLGITTHGHPRHPLYTRANAELVVL